MHFISQYGLFLSEALTIVFAILCTLAGVLALSKKPKPRLEIISLNKLHTEMQNKMQLDILGKKPEKKKKDKKNKKDKPTLFVLDFVGDIKASQVEQLREEITAVLAIATPNDEVVIRLESPGGSVNGYGLAASELQRIRDRKIPLTVCIDKVAASGGYLMAVVANQIIAAPFAFIGSIGVVAQLPNFHRWLEKNDIDVELITSGEFKRTLTVFGENTDKGRKKFQADLEAIHQNFRDYVLANRENLDIEKVATGEHWLANDAQKLALIDKIQTSDDYIGEKITNYNAFKISILIKQPWLNKILFPMMKLLHPLS